MDERVKIGILGAGEISGIYIENMRGLFCNLEPLGIYDVVGDRARLARDKYALKKQYQSYGDMLGDPDVEIVLDLTPPLAHFETGMAAINAGKHVFMEKPLAVSYDEGKRLCDAAAAKGVLLGAAPDTFLGAGIQGARKAMDGGAIGTPIGANARMICRGHERWHPNPGYYYQAGGGPLLDMGPYYITALVNLLGRVKKVSGFAKKTFDTRIISSQPLAGQTIEVNVPTWVSGNLEFENGAVAQLFTTFDVYYHQEATLELFGSESTLLAPNPDFFDGPVSLLDVKEGRYIQQPLPFRYSGDSRGIGLSDMAGALRAGGDFRANAMQGLHVLEIMESVLLSAQRERPVLIRSPYTRPAAMPEEAL